MRFHRHDAAELGIRRFRCISLNVSREYYGFVFSRTIHIAGNGHVGYGNAMDWTRVSFIRVVWITLMLLFVECHLAGSRHLEHGKHKSSFCTMPAWICSKNRVCKFAKRKQE